MFGENDDEEAECNIKQFLNGDVSKLLNEEPLAKTKMYASVHAQKHVSSFYEIEKESLGLN